MKKLGIFLFNNHNGSVEEYIKYLLDDLTSNLSHLCVIINNSLDVIDVFTKYTKDIFINNTFDNINIWREVIVNHVGFDQLLNYDEVILFDDSFFGPISSFKEIFKNIDDIELDLWTILSNGIDDKFNQCNLQFIAFRNNLIKSKKFKEFWLNVNSKSVINSNCENFLINYFSNLDFEWKNYLEVLNSESFDEEPSYFMFDIYHSIINYGLPLINIKPFFLPKKIHLTYNNGLDLSLTMNYLNQKTEYNVSLIYNYLVKNINPNELVNLLNLKKIIPKENLNNNYKSNSSIVVIAHIYYIDLLDYDFMFLKNIPEYIDIIITTDELDKKVFIEENYLSKLKNNFRVILVNPRGRDMSGLFVGCKEIIKDYDYFCFVHDKKSSLLKFNLNGISFRDIIWENTLASRDYINSIIKFFDENSCLGLIVPPRPYHGVYFTSFYYNHWVRNGDNAKKLLNKMNISQELDINESALSIGNCFWAKSDALKPLFDLNLNYDDFHQEPMPDDGTISHAIERIYGHVAASQGFYTEIVMTDEYGCNEITNYPYIITELFNIIRFRFEKNLNMYYLYSFLTKFEDNLNNLNKIIKNNTKKINEIENSNSWKMTKPLRMILFKFKNLSKLFK